MKKRKILIKEKQVVRDIRSGMDDVELMQKYGLSAANLDRLFQKLVQSGAMPERELDQRTRVSQRSHFVIFDGFPDVVRRQARVKASDALQAIQSGMSDIAIMNQYNLSVKGLDSLYSKLMAMGKLDQAEMDARRGVTDEDFGLSKGVIADRLLRRTRDDMSVSSTGPSETFWEEHKAPVTAAIGFAVGMAVFAALLIIGKLPVKFSGMNRLWHTSSQSPAQRPKIPETPATSSSASAEPDGRELSDAEEAELRKACLKGCKDNYRAEDDIEQTLLNECKRECIDAHSPQFRRIRERFYGGAGNQ